VSDIAIRVENLGKAYRIASSAGGKRYKTLQEDLLGFLKNPLRRGEKAETFWALKDVSFEVKHGEVLGIIGRNGAGKSTLLKILSRITRPTTGHADVYGRVGSLLEVGTGFHPELTGRENIYLNGAILGMSHAEIARRFDEIVAFAEVEQFLDTPAKRYSSGMYMRLAFAVAAHLDPEVLIVDEVLAVGDAEFQKKCLGKMSEVASSGRTVLFVSHNMGAVQQLCNRGLVLRNGGVFINSEISQAINLYLNSAETNCVIDRSEPEAPKKLHIQRVSLLNVASMPSNSFANSETAILRIACRIYQEIKNAQIAFEFSTSAGECIFSSTQMDYLDEDFMFSAGNYVFECPIELSFFRQGQYNIVVSSSVPNIEILDVVERPLIFEILDDLSPLLRLGQSRRGMILPILKWRHTFQEQALEATL